MQPEDRKAELVREWLTKADHDLDLAQRALQSPPLADMTAFHAQQAVEKALKAFLIWHELRFRWTHDLSELLKLCRSLDEEFDDFHDVADLLTPYAAAARYPGYGPPLSVDDAELALTQANDTVAFVRDRLPPEALL
jgi:HEPN domain-containing protein